MITGLEAFPEITARLDAEVDEQLFTKGAQVSVRVGGEEVYAYAGGDDGRGEPVAHHSVFRVYCTTKPIAALAVAALVDDGVVDLDEPLDRRLPDVRALADGKVTLRHVLSHAAGLHRPAAVEVELVPPERRGAFLAAVERPPRFAVGTEVAYSERFAWHVVGLVLEQASGEELGQHLRRRVLEPLGMADTWIGMSDEEYDAVVPRLGLNHDMRQLRSFPLLIERGRRWCTEVNAAHGGYTTARDLAQMYAAVLAQLDGADDPSLPSAATLRTFTSPVRPASLDHILDRVCTHGLGFMTDLSGHAFGPSVSSSSFGHSGNVGSSFAFADPARDLAVAVVFNGIVDPESAFLRRPVILRALYRDLDLLDVPAPVDGPPAETRGRWFRRGRARPEPDPGPQARR